MEYFPRSRRRKYSESATISPPPSSHARTTYCSHGPAVPEQSIYIFPNPSSAPPSPNPAFAPTTAAIRISSNAPVVPRSRSTSLVSVTTDLDWDTADPRSPALTSTVESEEASGLGIWEWPASAEESIGGSEVVLDEPIRGTSRWDLRVSRRSSPSAFPDLPLAACAHRSAIPTLSPGSLSWIRARTESAASSLSSVINIPIPHARIRIPLLSLFASILGIDESTIRLIEHTPPDSALFPGYIVESSDDDQKSDLCARPHGSSALLLGQKEYESLKEGVRTACDSSLAHRNPFVLNPLPLDGLFQIVQGIWTGGGNALRELLR